MSEPFIGQIQMFGFNFAPRGWAMCNGQLMDISQNAALFSLLGTTYGGDGRTTFALPDLRGRAALHQGSGPGLSPRTIGAKFGDESNTIGIGNMPSHTHQLHARAEDGTDPKPENNLLAGGTTIYAGGNQDTNMSTQAISNTGGGQPVNNMQPSLVITFCIALTGVFPSRN